MMFGRSDSPELCEPHKRARTARELSNKCTSETMDREGVLAALGYKPEKSWRTPAVLLEKSELCIRCGKKVYPVEKVDVGGLYHRSCFKCKTCNVQLNLRTFHRDVDLLQPKATREIYCSAHVPRAASGHVDAAALDIRRALDAQKHASSQMRGTGYEHTSHYTADALEFQHRAKSAKRRKKVRRRSTLRSYKDFEKFGVFDAQSTLEEIHRKEEDELYKQMSADRKRHINKLERHLAEEMKRTVAELVAWFEKRGASEQEKAFGIRKIENFYRTQREERMQLLVHRLTMEEQAAVARMIEKHSQEMLILIQEKEKEAEKAMRFQFRESQLYDDGAELFGSEDESEEDDQWLGEDEEESQEEVTESFSEASYRVELCENVNGVVQPEHNHRAGTPDLPERHSSVVSKQTDQVPGAGWARTTDPVPGDAKQPRANEPQHQAKQPQHQAKQPQHQAKQPQHEATQPQHQAIRPQHQAKQPQHQAIQPQHQAKQPQHQAIQPQHQAIQPQHQAKQPQHQAKQPQHQAVGQAGEHPLPTWVGGEPDPREPRTKQADLEPRQYAVRPLAEINRGVSLSQHLLHVEPPLEYLQVGDDDENGAVLVKVHAARDARLIDDRLRSHHYCTSPTSDGNYYDLTQSPRRPGSESSSARHGGQSTAPRKLTGQGKYMLFQRPGDLRDIELADDQRGLGSSGSLNSKRDRSGEGGRRAEGGHPEDEERNHDLGPASRDQLHNGRNEDDLEADPEGRFRGMTKSHADKARDALRAMSLGICDDSALSPECLFPDPSPIAPKVAPPKTKKATLYTNPSVFKEFDDNAIKETKRDHKTFTDLVRQLSKHCESELQRVRSIFRWITAKDLNKLQFDDNLDSDTPMGLLRGIKLGVESYHNLFKRLCSYAGLHCEIIEGYSKGAGYKPGARLRGNSFRNQWTAVCVDGAWRLVNCNWGARHVKGPRDERMTYRCDEFYFLTDPEEHIYQHFPDDPDWQLLARPLTLDQFVRLPLLKSPFFNRRLALAADYESVIHASGGAVDVRIVAPTSLAFAARLKSADGGVRPETLQDRVLVRRLNDEVIFLVEPPASGRYFLELYCGDGDDAESMDNVCAFRISCYAAPTGRHVSFPPVACFGRTAAFADFAVAEETHPDPYVVYSGHLLVALLCPDAVTLVHTMTRWNHRDRKSEPCDRYAFVVHRSAHVISYVIHCPKRGGYVFSLFASDERHPEPRCIHRYYVECPAPGENSFPLPKASKRWRHCRLIEPLNGDLPSGSRVRFRVESAVALEVVVNASGSWHGLKRSGNMWQGSVNTGENSGKLLVYGRFDKTREKYVPLLEYQVKGSRGVEELKSLTSYA